MTSSLENRSSLRKLDFPQSTQEALARLYGTFSTFAGLFREIKCVKNMILYFDVLKKTFYTSRSVSNHIYIAERNRNNFRCD